MPNDFINVNTQNSRLGSNLMAAAQNLRWAKDVMEALKEAMDHMQDGTVNWTVVEAQFGLPTGKGLAIYNLVSGSVNDMNNSTNITPFLQWLATCKG